MPGRLQELESLLQEVVPPESGITKQAILNALQLAIDNADRLSTLNIQLQQRRSEVNFKALFQAVQDRSEIIDRCVLLAIPHLMASTLSVTILLKKREPG